jgi:tetratricopeptide (TPR) repeat protein
MTSNDSLTCPFCGAEISEGTIECPSCHENLAGWMRVRYAHAIDYNEALALAREGRLDEAKARLAYALRAKESFAPAHILLAKISAQEGRWADARRSAERARELLPENERTEELVAAIAAAAEGASPAVDRPESEALPPSGQGEEHKHLSSTLLGAHWLGRYQQDIVRAFAVGVGLTTMMALLISRLSGKRPE